MAVRIAVLSGKGGVGKSSVACLLAKILSEQNKILLIDTDICGPSTSHILNTKEKLIKAERGLVPAKVSENLDLLSMALLINDSDSVIWRPPKKISLLNMFYESINHDYVIYDTPPGISEEHYFLVDKIDYVFVVTTSQNMALSDSIRSIEFAQENNLEIIGLIENMSGMECKGCKKITNIFSAKGGEALAEEFKINFLCKIPYDYELLKITNNGNFINESNKTMSYKILKEILKNKFN